MERFRLFGTVNQTDANEGKKAGQAIQHNSVHWGLLIGGKEQRKAQQCASSVTHAPAGGTSVAASQQGQMPP